MRHAPHAVFSDPALVDLPPLPEIRRVSVERSTTWLDRGFGDFVAHPGIGLVYGTVFALFGWLLTFGLAEMGMTALILPLAGGFMLVAPLLAVGLYEVSRRREAGEQVTLLQALGAVRRNGQMADMGLVLLLLFFVWIQMAMVIFALFYGSQPPAMDEFFSQVLMAPQGVAFVATGTVIGGIIAAMAFAVSVVSMPMLLDRKVSALTAMRTSLKAVWLNRMNMIGWAATLATLGFLGVAFLFIGLAFTLPIAAHASWHAYRDLVGE
jgi:uncharacterized membrane protein